MSDVNHRKVVEPRGCPTPGACSALDELAALRAQNEALRTAFDRYGRHDLDCRTNRSAICDCGYQASCHDAALQDEQAPSEPTAGVYTVRYSCGCTATGGRAPLPNYCPEHPGAPLAPTPASATPSEPPSDSFVDEQGTTWLPPSAWAYAMTCKALDRDRNGRNVAELEMNALREQNDRLRDGLLTPKEALHRARANAAEAECQKLRKALRNLITPDNFSVYATTDLIAAAVAALADHSRAAP